MVWRFRFAVAVSLLIGAPAAMAAVSAEEAKRLEGDLTPVGAERAGNAAGAIPAWDGGLTAPPPGISFTKGGHYPDPFATDRPLFKISAANMAQYAGQLTDAHKALLSAYPDSYFMNVYPTRRSCAYPAHVYAAAKRNALTGQLTNGGNGFTGATIAYPFPITQNAREMLWNHELRYQGYHVTRESASATPTKGGDFTLDVSLDQWIYRFANPELVKVEDLENVQMHFIKRGISPPSNAGALSVTHNTIDHTVDKRRGWVYRPGERKVKRVVGAEYDNFIPISEGIRTNDNFNIFNGGGDLYDWEFLGKQEKFIPYNNYHFASHDVKYKDILTKQHLNPEHLRYELHRTWVIEARLKPGKQHRVANLRRKYLDEDSWAGVAAALYDGAGKLSRAQEAHIFNYYDQPLCNIGSDVVYDIPGGRYHIVNMRNEQKPVKFEIELPPESFTPEGMRGLGVR